MGLNQTPILVDSNKNAVTYTVSPPIGMSNYYALNIQIIFSGTPNLTAVLQTSLDYQPGGPQGGPAKVAGTWVNYQNSSQTVTSGASCVWDIFGTAAAWFRVSSTFTSGTGNIVSILAQVKG